MRSPLAARCGSHVHLDRNKAVTAGADPRGVKSFFRALIIVGSIELAQVEAPISRSPIVRFSIC
jgi:hypothetical protein